nr:RNA-directed DNA polymerase, eukaryota, reverse transcriptase zinc-binding domain protein [Tanacetum cinerariifolium]
MFCYLAGMEPYYLKCIKDCPFQPKTADGDAKPESRWTLDKRRVFVHDQRLKSIIMSCLPDDIMKSGLKNANHIQTLDLADIYERFVYEDNLIHRRTTQIGEKINEKWLTSSKKVSQCINEQIPHQNKKFLGGELLTESLSKININENSFILASMGYDQEMVLKTKDWIERLNPDNKLPNFNTGRILVFKSQAVNESLETLNTPKSSKDSKAKFLTPLPPLKNLQEASLSSEVLGKFAFDYVHNASVGNSDGILCVWDPKMFKKINDTILDYFIMVRGVWMPNGEVVIMCDFDDVRNKFERYFHYWFEMEGFEKFVEESWKEASATDSNALAKMVKKLKYLKENIRIWNKSNKEMTHNKKRSLKAELAECDSVIDKGEREVNVVNKRTEWSELNINNVVNVLELFHHASGLRINMFKRLKVGSLMSRIHSWNEMIDGMIARVIKAMHGDDEKIRKKAKSGYPSIWLDIIHEGRWLGVGKLCLKSLYLRMYALESHKSIDVASKLSHIGLEFSFCRAPRGGVEQSQFELIKEKLEGCNLVDMKDRWVWALKGSGDFSVASVRKMIDDFMLPLNISHRGMDIDSILYLMCGKVAESSRHVFFTYHISSEIFRKIVRWWDIDYMEVSSYDEWLYWIVNIRLSIKHKNLFEEVCYMLWCHVWSFHNKCIFGRELPSKAIIFDDAVSRSFYWCHFRCKVSFSWVEWLCNTPKLGRSGIIYPGALLHNTIAQVMRKRSLTMTFEKKS